jgi:NAD(P)-dependent dehydrogenase (short-subunit alcohol dehydrogenase family)
MTSSPAKNVFITGAGAGIGRAAALRFAKAGWRVGLFDVDEAAVAALAQALRPALTFHGRLDVSQAQDWQVQLAAFAQFSGDSLDVLVNNAGISATAPFTDTPLARHHQVVDVNIKGVINGCHLAFPYLKRTPGSRVINLCSASALFGQPMLSSYSATKAAVRSLTESLSIEWREHGIAVADLLPLFVNTAMVTGDVSRMKTVSTLGVRLSPDDVAAAIERLATMPQHNMPLHTTVGLQTWLFALLGKLSPDAINRFVTARMAGYK